MPDTNNVQLRAAIHKVEFLSFEVLKNLKREIPRTEFRYNMVFEISIDITEKLVRIATTISLLKKEQETKLCEIKTNIEIFVENINEIISQNAKNRFEISDTKSNSTLINICISTTRGMLAMCIRDTPFKKAVIPLVSTKSIKKKAP